MKLCSDVIYTRLSMRTNVTRSGRNLSQLTLNGPIFYTEGAEFQDGFVYIGRTGEMPDPENGRSCLLISVGGREPVVRGLSKWERFNIVDRTDILTVFNLVQEVFLEYAKWSERLWEIAENDGDFSEMVEMTSHLFGRWIVLTDNSLEIVASCYGEGGSPDENPLSLEAVEMFAPDHKRNTMQREPFLFQLSGQDAYCYNIFYQDEYVGVISIQAEDPPLSPGEKHLFEFFAQFVFKAIRRSIRKSRGGKFSISAAFSDLLSCLPVNQRQLGQRIKELYGDGARWICVAIEVPASLKGVPIDYFCSQVEERFENGYAVPSSSDIALLIPLDDAEVRTNDHFPNVDRVLGELGVRAGISYPFSDLMLSRGFFRQAQHALSTLGDAAGVRRVAYFSETVLEYMLANASGEFSPEHLVPAELFQMLDENLFPREYWDTLRCYLDNEMNASKTARDMNVHRTTLLKRLERILSLVDMETPEERLLVRLWIRILEKDGFIS